MNLKDRLALLRTAGRTTVVPQQEGFPLSDALAKPQRDTRVRSTAHVLRAGGWKETAPLVWRREIERIVPGLRHGADPATEWAELSGCVYFDLETTGLSGGSGTVPFLCTTGALEGQVMLLRQVYLEDFPGEPDFLDAVIDDLSSAETIVSYNGACFDMPLLQTRCIMNRRRLPVFCHHDVLRDCRRLWGRTLESCSLQNCESFLLDKTREHDVPGFMVPRVWLEAVKAERLTEAQETLLERVWYHNAEDVVSLAGLHRMVIRAYRHPDWAIEELRADPSALFRILLHAGRKENARELLVRVRDGQIGSWLEAEMRSRALRHLAAWAWRIQDNQLLAATVLAMDESAEGCIARAKLYEHRLRNVDEALRWARKARALLEEEGQRSRQGELGAAQIEHRIARLERKAGRQGMS